MNTISVFYEHIAEAAKQRGISEAEACRAAAGFGYSGVELDVQRVEKEGDMLLPMLSAAGLKVNCVYAFMNLGAAENADAADDAEITRVLALCERANTKMLLAVPGFLTESEMQRGSVAYEARRVRIAGALSRLVKRAEKIGIAVVMEDFDGETAPFSMAAELLWFMQNVPGLGCAFDTGNFLFSEESAEDVLADFLPYLAAVHCKDRTFTPNAGEEKRTTKGRAMYPVAVGDGCIDIAGMMRKILDTGYTGNFAAEHFGSENQMEAMQRSADFLKQRISK